MIQPDIFDLLAEEEAPTEPAHETRPICPRCDHLHCPSDAYSIGRFSPTPTRYRANYPNAPIRDTRAQAADDLCNYRAALNRQEQS